MFYCLSCETGFRKRISHTIKYLIKQQGSEILNQAEGLDTRKDTTGWTAKKMQVHWKE